MISIEQALGLAGQIWCQPTTRDKIMDPELAFAFAEILQQFSVIPVNKARHTILEAFKEDPSFKQTYVDNVAMCLYDMFENKLTLLGFKNPFIDKNNRDAAAYAILSRIFEE